MMTKIVAPGSLYSTSAVLKRAIGSTIAQMAQATGRPVELMEYIILPDWGQRVILRFGLGDDRNVSFEDADQLEPYLRELAGPDYWVTLVGDVYGAVLPNLSLRLAAIDRALEPDLLQFPATRHTACIRADAQVIRGALSLTSDDLLWEIEVPVAAATDAPTIRVTGTRRTDGQLVLQGNPERIMVGDISCDVVYLQDDPSFRGCVKAYMMAQRQHVALASYIAHFEGAE